MGIAATGLQLTAVQGVSEETVSIAELAALARVAFQTDVDTGCGDMVFEVVAEDEVQSAFLFLDIKGETLTLRPDANTPAGTYTGAVLKFYFMEFQEVYFDVKITSNVEPCIVTSLSFNRQRIEVDFELATENKKVTLSSIIPEPACGSSYTV